MSEWQDYPSPHGAGGHTVQGTLKRLPALHSPQLDRTREILVYLPPSYEAVPDRRYPVIYMHDGQNLFDEATAFAGEWHVDELMDDASAEGLEALVVGVPNAGKKRAEEYSPFRDAKGGGGRGDAYLAFLAETLKPLIDTEFRTRPERASTGIAGSSLGGLISLYGFFARGDTFGFAGAMSPALWFAERAIFEAVRKAPFVPGRIYLDVGTREGRKTVQDVRRMRDLLAEKGYAPGKDLLYVVDQGAPHHEAAWSRRFPREARFLLRGATDLENGGNGGAEGS